MFIYIYMSRNNYASDSCHYSWPSRTKYKRNKRREEGRNNDGILRTRRTLSYVSKKKEQKTNGHREKKQPSSKVKKMRYEKLRTRNRFSISCTLWIFSHALTILNKTFFFSGQREEESERERETERKRYERMSINEREDACERMHEKEKRKKKSSGKWGRKMESVREREREKKRVKERERVRKPRERKREREWERGIADLPPLE